MWLTLCGSTTSVSVRAHVEFLLVLAQTTGLECGMLRRTDFSHLRRPTISTRSYRRYRQGPGIDRPAARAVIAVVLALFVVAFALVRVFARAGPSEQALELAHLNPQQLMGDSTQHFLATPVAAIPADPDIRPLAPTVEQVTDAGADHVRVVDPGGVGVLLRSAPTDGRLVASLHNGQVLEVLERRKVNDVDWLRVRTTNGIEGWVFGGLVLPAP